MCKEPVLVDHLQRRERDALYLLCCRILYRSLSGKPHFPCLLSPFPSSLSVPLARTSTLAPVSRADGSQGMTDRSRGTGARYRSQEVMSHQHGANMVKITESISNTRTTAHRRHGGVGGRPSRRPGRQIAAVSNRKGSDDAEALPRGSRGCSSNVSDGSRSYKMFSSFCRRVEWLRKPTSCSHTHTRGAADQRSFPAGGW